MRDWRHWAHWGMVLTAATAWACNTSPAEPDPNGDAPAATEPDYDLVFDATQVFRYELDIPAATWEAMLLDPLSDDYHEATFTWGDEVYEPVGVRFKGNSSRWTVASTDSTRFSFKVKFAEYVAGQTFHGLKKLNLHNQMGDPSFMRERLSYPAFADVGVPASRVAYVELFLNGEYHGLYTSVQQVNKPFLREWLGNDEGNLYKPEPGDLTYQGETIDDYGHVDSTGVEAYELKTNEDLADYSGLLHFIDVLDNTPDIEFEAAIAEVFEVELFLKWLAANTLMVALDSYAGSIAHNYYLYDNPETGRFVYIPWDLNGSFGTFSCGGLSFDERIRLNIDIPFCTRPMGAPGSLLDQRPLIARILAVAAYETRYRELLAEYVDGRLSEATVDAAIDQWHLLIDDYVRDDPTKFFTYDEYLLNLDSEAAGRFGLRSFNADRNAYVRASLDGSLVTVCGDGFCDSDEECEVDCDPSATCPACFEHDAILQRCIPSCAAPCTCPIDAPFVLICEPVREVCVPEPPECNCDPDQVCTPMGDCVPKCITDTSCPPVVPICDTSTGLCHQ